MRTILFILLIAFAAAAMSHTVLACVCEREAIADAGPTAERAIRDNVDRAALVFIGRMVSQTGAEQHFEVAKVLKGAAHDTVVMHQGRIDIETGSRVLTSCDYTFALREEYLVYAFDVDGKLWTHYCSRTRPIDNAVLDLALIEQMQRRAKSN